MNARTAASHLLMVDELSPMASAFEYGAEWALTQYKEWVYEDELPDGYPYDKMFRYSRVDGVRLFPGKSFVNGYMAAVKEAREPCRCSPMDTCDCGKRKRIRGMLR